MVKRIELTPYILDANLARQPFDMRSLAYGQNIAGTPYVLAPGEAVAPPPPPPPPPGEYRDVFEQPWATVSWHNTAIGSGAIYEATGTGTTGFLQTYDTFSPGIGIGINQARWSVRIYQAQASDPTVTLVYYKDYIGNTNPAPTTYQIKCPLSAIAAGGTDRHVTVVQPDGFTAYEIYKFIWHDSTQTQIDSSYVNINDIRLHGLRYGSRGSGISMLSGLIRYQELLDLDIPHVLAMSVPDDMLATGPHWPARLDDSQTVRPWGNLPNAVHYGMQFAIPPSVNLNDLGLTPMGLAIGKALQDYGVFPLVQADHICLVVEPMPTQTYQNPDETTMPGLSAAADDWEFKLFPLLRRITNNNPGTLDANRVPLDPSGIAGGGTRRRAAPLPLPSEVTASGLNEVVCWGDSLTAANWPETTLASRLGVTVHNRGYGGQGSTDIATRQGGIVPTVTVSANSIPSSGAVAVTSISPSTGWRVNGTGTFTFAGTLAGVAGNLRHDLVNDTWDFNRTSSGSVVACSPGTPFIVSSALANHQQMISTFWTGRNNINQLSAAVTAATAMINHLTASPKRYIVLGVTNSYGETEGTTNHTNIVATNNQLASLYPNNFLDIRRYLIDNGLARAGITPTAQDTIDIGNDVIPSSLKNDTIHLNSAGYAVVGDAVADFIEAKGWV